MYHDNVFFGYQSIARRVVPEAERAHKRVGEMDGAALLVRAQDVLLYEI